MQMNQIPNDYPTKCFGNNDLGLPCKLRDTCNRYRDEHYFMNTPDIWYIASPWFNGWCEAYIKNEATSSEASK